MVKKSVIFISQVIIGVVIALSLHSIAMNFDRIFSQNEPPIVVSSQSMEIIPTEDEQRPLKELYQQQAQLNMQKVGMYRLLISRYKIDMKVYDLIENNDGTVKFVVKKEDKKEGKP